MGRCLGFALVCLSCWLHFKDLPTIHAKEPIKPLIIQPRIGYDQIGTAQYGNGILRLKTHVWEEKETREKRTQTTLKIQNRTGRKPQINPKTGVQEMVPFSYDIAIPVTSEDVVVVKQKVASKSIVTDHKSPEYTVFNLDGRQLNEAELIQQLTSAKTVLVVRSPHYIEQARGFSELFRGMLHPSLLIVNIPEGTPEANKVSP